MIGLPVFWLESIANILAQTILRVKWLTQQCVAKLSLALVPDSSSLQNWSMESPTLSNSVVNVVIFAEIQIQKGIFH